MTLFCVSWLWQDGCRLSANEPTGRLHSAQRASYNTRHGAEDYEPYGCMDGTREEILADLESWALDPSAPKVFWLNGLVGTGKTSIAHTLSERLDGKLKLGASFFCSRSTLNDATLILPTIVSMLARSSPRLQSVICKALEDNPDVASLNSFSEQFTSLIIKPIKSVFDKDIKIYKIVVIDALDECSSPMRVESLIKAVLDGVADIPFKFIISSRPERQIRNLFRSVVGSTFRVFSLHIDVAIDAVQRDIKKYLKSKLSTIRAIGGYSQSNSTKTPEDALTVLSDGLFIYAAIAIRYILEPNADPAERLSNIIGPETLSSQRTRPFDNIYKLIMDQAFDKLEPNEIKTRLEVLSTVVLLQMPLCMGSIDSLLGLKKGSTKSHLSPFHSVIRGASEDNVPVAVFHASFRDFVVNQDRCREHWVAADTGHQILAQRCLQCLNKSLRRNICNLPEESIRAHSHEIKGLNVIPEALRYSSLHWASHLTDTLGNSSLMLVYLSRFARNKLVHWFECLSAIGELESGIKSLSRAKEATSVSDSMEENSS